MPVREVIAFASSDDAVSKAEFWHVYFSMASEKGKKKKKRGGGGRRRKMQLQDPTHKNYAESLLR